MLPVGGFLAALLAFRLHWEGKPLKTAILQGLFTVTLPLVGLIAPFWTFEVGGQNRFLLAAGVGAGIGLAAVLLDIWARARIRDWA
jgi:hypothetical protein